MTVREKWAWALVFTSLREKGSEEARAVLNSAGKQWLTPIMSSVLEAEISQKAGDQKGAHAIATEALSLIGDDTDSESIAHLGVLFESAGDYDCGFWHGNVSHIQPPSEWNRAI